MLGAKILIIKFKLNCHEDMIRYKLRQMHFSLWNAKKKKKKNWSAQVQQKVCHYQIKQLRLKITCYRKINIRSFISPPSNDISVSKVALVLN